MRNIINLNENWKFIQNNVGLPSVYPTDWKTVDLPHTWNAVDGNDGNGSYDRGNYWYAKTFETPKQPLAGGKVFVEFNNGKTFKAAVDASYKKGLFTYCLLSRHPTLH